MKERRYMVFDYETRSRSNLKLVGATEYAKCDTTDILCCAWKLGTKAELKKAPIHLWTLGAPERGTHAYAGFIDALLDPGVVLVAHNAFFEQVITYFTFAERRKHRAIQAAIPPERWVCTAALAAALALPRNLEGAANALGLPVKKDMEGRRLMLKYAKPRRATKKSDAPWHADPNELARIHAYCKKDVEVETELLLRLPPLTPTERKVWVLDQKINHRGVLVDRPLVATALDMIDQETKAINERTDQLTMGIVRSATQVGATRDWLEGEGVFLPDLRRKTVEDAVKDGLVEGRALELLQCRAAVSKTSTKKYQAFDARSRSDGRLRDNLVYHAASTGRWGGSGVQLQNLPRPSLKDAHQAAEIVAQRDLELVRLLYGEPMEVFSSCLRSVLIAPSGKTLDVADYAAIEARVLFWLANHEDGLNAFREGRDLYREQAAQVFGTTADKIAKDSFERFLGKTLILGAGYGLGAKKFAESCRAQGQDVSDDLAEAAIKAYRSLHVPVVKLWSNVQQAAIAAVENLGKKYTVNHTSWWVKDGFLWCELPSGRRLAYCGPEVRYETPRFWKGAEKRPVLYHWGVDSTTKKWVLSGTYYGPLVENVTQAVARDLMAEAMLRIEAAGPWEIVLSVHDELVAERDLKSAGTIEQFCDLMAELPAWAKGLPVKAEGWTSTRYKK